MENPPPTTSSSSSSVTAATKPATEPSRKRPRAGTKTDAATTHQDDDDNDQKPAAATPSNHPSSDNNSSGAVVLTPHTLRLLKLVQDGSADHARMAAMHLEELTRPEYSHHTASSSSSPLVLWEILGRLQGFLGARDWRTRANAGRAMEGVARNLPRDDQQDFLRRRHDDHDHDHHDHDAAAASKGRQQHEGWLRLSDVQTNLATILEQGRELMASAESRYELQREEQALERLAEGADEHGETKFKQGESEQTRIFCARRLELQRQILARRLGLSTVMTRYATNLGEQFQQNLLQEGLEAMDQPEAITSMEDDDLPKKKRRGGSKKSKGNAASFPEPEAPKSIRAILVKEIRQQQQQETSREINHHHAISHRFPQDLLAGELVYRTFDPSWHVRHGALMGILALIRAWKVHQQASSENDDSLFGTWPHDILARSLCVLALDRFGDFSGTSTEAYSGAMVAPVREIAAQVFSVVYSMAPTKLQQQAREILANMMQSDEWEVRQGAMLAVKYCVAMAKSSQNSSADIDSTTINITIAGLEDRSDDVQGVAAQTLQQVVRTKTEKADWVHSDTWDQVIHKVWHSLANIRLFSSSLEDIVTLFCSVIKRTPEIAAKISAKSGSVEKGTVLILKRLEALMGSEFLSVKTSILHVIGSLVNQLSAMLDLKMKRNSSKEMKECFCGVVKTVYTLRLESSNNIQNDDCSDVKRLLKECSATWSVLSTVQDRILGPSDPLRFELEFFLLVAFFRMDNTAISDARAMSKASGGESLSSLCGVAAFLASFWTLGRSCGDDDKISYQLLIFAILVGLDSPLIYHCEASCCLVRYVLDADTQVNNDEAAAVTAMIQPCVRRTLEILQHGPTCLGFEMNSSYIDQSKGGVFLQAFHGGMNVILSGESADKSAAAVVELWQKLVPSTVKSTATAATVESMRVNSLLAGTLMAGGTREFPEKLTPIVRPLMTSVQNERDEHRQLANCEFLHRFLLLLGGPASDELTAGYQKTFGKVLSNLCNFVVNDIEPSSTAASNVIGSMVNTLPSVQILFSMEPISAYLGSMNESWKTLDKDSKQNSVLIFRATCSRLRKESTTSEMMLKQFLPALAEIGCTEEDEGLQILSHDIVSQLCNVNDTLALELVIPVLIGFLKDESNDDHRARACMQLSEVFKVIRNPATLACFVRTLLPVVMSLMTDSVKSCADMASKVFSNLVQLAPLVKETSFKDTKVESNEADLVIDHLIHGKKLPPCEIPESIIRPLSENGIVLRNYQVEGISWLRFLQSLKLNGALCDSMGLGKTLQSLVAVALAHLDSTSHTKTKAISLVVCPSSVVGHWINEIKRFFPDGNLFQSIALIGASNQRKAILDGKFSEQNIVVTSYAVMRSEIDKLSAFDFTYTVLDEGHLLKNPKTATARASRRLRSRHKLILTGTPVMNRVQEVWASFDFLLPSFLGSAEHFAKEFARPISKGQKLDATATDVAAGMEKLKVLHQQVLPFILRREKRQVLKELPPKVVTEIPCAMSTLQEELYRHFCSSARGKESLKALHKLADPTAGVSDDSGASATSFNGLTSLLYLRLLCTHPWLIRSKNGNREMMKKCFTIEASGKLLALLEILRESGLNIQDHVAADGDASLLYCDKDADESMEMDEYETAVRADAIGPDVDISDGAVGIGSGAKCLIFAQFMDSLDVVEELVLKRFLPTVRYLRLDGRVPTAKRSSVVDEFNQDENIRILLLTTKIGGLGLNLTGANIVVFLEHDWNPHTDLQAMDRAHRLGQSKTVHVYKLVTQNSIEQTTMAIHERKMIMSNAIVNTDNSSLYSMGTEKLLDIFSTSASKSNVAADFEDNLDALVERYQDEYQSLSMDGFVKSFQSDDGNGTEQ